MSTLRHTLLAISLVLAALPARAQTSVPEDAPGARAATTWWAPALVGMTLQSRCWAENGSSIDCSGTGQDGETRSGVAWPNPRFTLNGDGTVTDNLTGAVWLADANCFGPRTWEEALADANALADGACGLSDGSSAGDWHLPSAFELLSLICLGHSLPAVTNAAGTGKWTTNGDAFSNIQVSSASYWSSTTMVGFGSLYAWYLYTPYGSMAGALKTEGRFVWPVRQRR